jgi:hypothetical protein
MDHAEARERIADLALEPRRLVGLEAEPTPDERALLVHVQGCPACRADLDGWRRMHEAVLVTRSLDVPLSEPALDAVDDPGAIRPPASLRVAVSAIPGRSPRLLDPHGATASTPAAAPRGWRTRWRLPALAAVFVVLVVGVGLVAVEQGRQADVARRQAAELAELTTTLDHVLRETGHTSIALVGPDGAPAGTAAWSSSEIVVMTTVLGAPMPGAEYRCWVERDGQRTPIGVMRFADGVGYWSGPLDRYGDLSLLGGGRLGVSLEVPGQGGGSAPVLLGELPS